MRESFTCLGCWTQYACTMERWFIYRRVIIWTPASAGGSSLTVENGNGLQRKDKARWGLNVTDHLYILWISKRRTSVSYQIGGSTLLEREEKHVQLTRVLQSHTHTSSTVSHSRDVPSHTIIQLNKIKKIIKLNKNYLHFKKNYIKMCF